LIISEAEMEILKNQFKVDESLLFYLPFMLDKISRESIQRFPNFDSIKNLKTSIWPLIKQQIPSAELHVYGAYPSQKVVQLHNEKEGFHIKGFAEDVNTVMQNARVCFAPLSFGAGLKGKLNDAMQNGTPSVMTSIAAEGMFGNLEPNGYIEDNPQVFAQKAVELYTNENIWKTYQTNGFEIINKRFNRTNFEIKLKETIEHVTNNLETLRLQNFTGAMLHHHSMQSTKFMSRWIEEKNKKTNVP